MKDDNEEESAAFRISSGAGSSPFGAFCNCTGWGKAPFEVIKLTGEDSNGTAGETLFYVIPDKKVLVSYYAAGAPNVYPYKATWTALNADGQEVSDVTIKCDDLKVLAGQESIFEITYNGKTETYKQYYMQEGYLCSAVAYSVYADNDTPHITRKNSGRLDRNGCMSITVLHRRSPRLHGNPHLRWNIFMARS